jgi:4-aminobutyrate aminotransferase
VKSASNGPSSGLASEGDVNLSPARQAWLATLDEPTRALLAEDAQYFFHQSLSTPCLDVVTSAGGATLGDVAGRRILDFHGNSVHQVGYAHPRVIAAIKAQLDQLSIWRAGWRSWRPAGRTRSSSRRVAPRQSAWR